MYPEIRSVPVRDELPEITTPAECGGEAIAGPTMLDRCVRGEQLVIPAN